MVLESSKHFHSCSLGAGLPTAGESHVQGKTDVEPAIPGTRRQDSASAVREQLKMIPAAGTKQRHGPRVSFLCSADQPAHLSSVAHMLKATFPFSTLQKSPHASLDSGGK